jgi:hypothetical protein
VEAVEVDDVEDGVEEGGSDDEVGRDVPVVAVDDWVVPEVLLVDDSVDPHAANVSVSAIAAARAKIATIGVTTVWLLQRRVTGPTPTRLIRHPSCRVDGRLPTRTRSYAGLALRSRR